ncbi:MAG TPA: hypothetical protein VFW46_08905, partial [Stellaceae bacterium]|nr:hypothetical protein [Stellaceae bacterium]
MVAIAGRLARQRHRRLRPAPFSASARAVDAEFEPAPSRPIDLAVSLSLVAAGILPPVALVALPGLVALIGPLPTAASLIGAFLLAPAAVGLTVALVGMERVRARFRARADNDHEHAILRILAQALLLAYAFGLAAMGAEAAVPCLPIGIVGLALGWSLLLHLVLSPAPSALRRGAAIVGDVALLSAFLHFGGAETAFLYPVYLAAIFYAGLRLDSRALVTAAIASVAGFAAVAVTTPFWQAQAGLSAGLIAVLAALPGGVALLTRNQARLRDEATEASEARARFLTVIGRGLRGPVDAMARALPGAETAASGSGVPARALLAQISEVLDLAAIESGELAPRSEPFDLHAVVNDTLAPLREAAARQGVALAVRLDPLVPYRLSGWAAQIGQILNSLAIAAIAASDGGTVRVEIGAAARFDALVPLRMSVRGQGDERDDDAFGLAVVRRLVELMGGRYAVGPGARSVTLPLAVDHSAAPMPLDLSSRPILLVTEDSQFAGELAEPLNAWNADTRWVGGLDDALIYVERFETPLAPILIVDGRVRVIPALSFVHRAALVRDDPPFILFVADGAQIESLSGIGDGELTALLPAPLTDRVLENALHALPLEPPPAVAERTSAPEAAPEHDADDDRVTPIA